MNVYARDLLQALKQVKRTKTLRELFLDALIAAGYDVITAIELWNVTYHPEIKALPPGKYTYNIGKHEITFKKVSVK